ncbi:MAG: formate dehydrogenase accessory sulfurtransferase FdhD, partial [Thermoplasmata archaeon]|nr:formate dehydrogenase accessory sulfurtransferase FdhD [Thermoplasmata archaeon]
MKRVPIIKISSGEREEALDLVTEELTCRLLLNGEHLATLLASPENLKELAAGFIFTSGFISSRDDIKEILYDHESESVNLVTKKKVSPQITERILSSGCGRGIVTSLALDDVIDPTFSFTVSSENISALMRKF